MTTTSSHTRLLAEDTLRTLKLPEHEATTMYDSETGTSLTVSTPKGHVCVTAFPEGDGEHAYASVDVCRSDFRAIASGKVLTGGDERYLNEITTEFLRHVIDKFNA